MLDINDIVSTVEINLGLEYRKTYQRSEVVSLVATYVQVLRDDFGNDAFSHDLKTVAQEGEYTLPEEYDKVISVEWPAAWYVGRFTDTDHGEPIGEAPRGGRMDGNCPMWVPYQEYVTARQLGSFSSYTAPRIWTHWRATSRNESDQEELSSGVHIGLYPSAGIEAGLTISLHVELVPYVTFIPNAKPRNRNEKIPKASGIPLPVWMKMLLEHTVTSHAALLPIVNDPQRSAEYARRAEAERLRLIKRHVRTQSASIIQMDAPWPGR